MDKKIQICMCSPRFIIISLNNKCMDKEVDFFYDKVNYQLFIGASSRLPSSARKNMPWSFDEDTEAPIKLSKALNMFCASYWRILTS